MPNKETARGQRAESLKETTGWEAVAGLSLPDAPDSSQRQRRRRDASRRLLPLDCGCGLDHRDPLDCVSLEFWTSEPLPAPCPREFKADCDGRAYFTCIYGCRYACELAEGVTV